MARPEPLRITVSQVRQAVADAVANPAGRGWGAAAGRLFHRIAENTVNPASAHGWASWLTPDGLDDPAAFELGVYDRVVGPELSRHAGALQEHSEGALALWEASRQLCRWLLQALEGALQAGRIAYDPQTEKWRDAERLIETEPQVSWELEEPGWSRPVRIEGRIDAVWRRSDGAACVVEYKLGSHSEELALLQACLYRAMLAANGDGSGGGVALLRFEPAAVEQFIDGGRLDEVESRLRELIGRVAGVTGADAGADREITTAAPQPVSAQPRREPTPEPTEEHILEVFEEYQTPVEIAAPSIAGPTFLRFFLRPRRGIDVSRVLRHGENLQVRLHLSAAPFVHITNGRVVCDIQRKNRQVVRFEDVAGAIPRPATGSARVLVGVDLEGVPQFADLSDASNAHILVAGGAGSGKSEWVRSAIASLVAANTPDTLRLVLIDPKRSAFNDLRDSPYLLAGLGVQHPPEDDVVAAFERLVEEMEERYRLLERVGADDLASLPAGERPPRIVCVCDEYYDLIAGDKKRRKEIESLIGRLGAKARAAGVHLIVATQKPSRDVVKGALSANMACRVGLRTTSPIESRMIIHQPGAEKLLGRGDLFFVDVGSPQRLQAPLISAAERARLFRG